MSVSVDPLNGDLVVGGFEKGIGDSPYSGLTDLKSVNTSSIPGEASVSFATSTVTQASSSSATYANLAVTPNNNTSILVSGLNTLSYIENGQALTFPTSTISGASTGTLYWATGATSSTNTSQFIGITLTYGGPAVTTLGATGTATLTVVPMGNPKAIVSGKNSINKFMLDSNGRVWSNKILTSGGNVVITNTSSWTYIGNTPPGDGTGGVGGNGNGLVYWRTAYGTPNFLSGDYDGWLFIFRDGFIDYTKVDSLNNGVTSTTIGAFTYGWNPTTGTTGVATAYLAGQKIAACPHNAIVAPDGNMYFVDNFTTWKIQQTDIVTPKTFSPTDTTSYISTQARNLPIQEIATCIAPFGTNFIIGGAGNSAYVWNGVDQLTHSYPILLPEAYVSQIVTVNTQSYIFAGNRGNIYISNGSQANLYKKIPDHLSGVVEPYFLWGGTTYQKNKLYFSASVVNNAGTAITGYGGVWAIDLATDALYLSNQLSYGTYGGYASAILSIPSTFGATSLPTTPAGYGLLIGWVNGSTSGMDNTISNPYTGGQSSIISDMIPIGTAFRPITGGQLEFKVSTPLVTGESVQLLMASNITGAFTSVGTTTGTGVELSGNFPINVQQQEWLLVKAILTSTVNTPSYCRITQLRALGFTTKDLIPTQPFSIQ